VNVENLGEMPATQLWRASINRATAHRVAIRPDLDAVFVSDGWGVNYAAIRFSRLDIASGRELASARTGTASTNGPPC
jgi:hypothetical protein